MTAVLLALLILGCGAGTIPPTVEVRGVDPTQITDPLKKQIRQSQESLQATTTALESQVDRMRREVRLATQKAEVAAEEARKAASRPIPKTFVHDPTPIKAGVDDLLSRADIQGGKLEAASRQLRQLSDEMGQLQIAVGGLQEFAQSPKTFVQTHGVSGLLMLLATVVSYLTGKKRGQKWTAQR